LESLNQKVEGDSGQINSELLEVYAWTGMQLNNLELAKKNVLAKFRLRGTGSYRIM
jgi:hypothetical protein